MYVQKVTEVRCVTRHSRSAIAAAYADWLATSRVPKLFVKAEPGLLVGGGANLEFARGLPVQTEVTVAGVHFLHEDSPDEIGRAIAGWMGAVPSSLAA